MTHSMCIKYINIDNACPNNEVTTAFMHILPTSLLKTASSVSFN
jgi:hypothetical protein